MGCTQLRGKRSAATGGAAARFWLDHSVMEHVIPDAESSPILVAPIVTIATTLALVIFTALLGQ